MVRCDSINYITVVQYWEDGHFYEGKFDWKGEGGFITKKEASPRFNFSLELVDVGLEGE